MNAGQGAIKRKSEIPALVSASDRFKRFKPQEESAARIREIRRDPALDELHAAFFGCDFAYDLDNHFGKCLEAVGELSPSAEQVERFSIAIGELQGRPRFFEQAGLFLSALTLKSSDEIFTIRTGHFSFPLDNLGFANSKTLRIIGDAGSGCGNRMMDGRIDIEGNSGNACGFMMEGGIIHVSGNAGDYCGQYMKGGRIRVSGSAGWFCGESMKGGLIILEKGPEIGSGGIGMGMSGGRILIKEEDGGWRVMRYTGKKPEF